MVAIHQNKDTKAYSGQICKLNFIIRKLSNFQLRETKTKETHYVLFPTTVSHFGECFRVSRVACGSTLWPEHMGPSESIGQCSEDDFGAAKLY